ncbi:hypothetical protein B484DRAFT_415954, partial [Ochromonadaceae sp. CCMP2298]
MSSAAGSRASAPGGKASAPGGGPTVAGGGVATGAGGATIRDGFMYYEAGRQPVNCRPVVPVSTTEEILFKEAKSYSSTEEYDETESSALDSMDNSSLSTMRPSPTDSHRAAFMQEPPWPPISVRHPSPGAGPYHVVRPPPLENIATNGLLHSHLPQIHFSQPGSTHTMGLFRLEARLTAEGCSVKTAEGCSVKTAEGCSVKTAEGCLVKTAEGCLGRARGGLLGSVCGRVLGGDCGVRGVVVDRGVRGVR